jgi:glycosyltransferase involved in cell wall biosynthesis
VNAKNILELCLSPDLGGLELYMVRASHFLNAYSVININGKLEPYYQNTDFKYSKIGRYQFLKLARLIDENDIDVLHFHWTKDIPIAVLAKLLSRKKPKLVQTRNMRMTRFKYDFYHRFLYKNIDMMLPVTYQVKEQIEKFIPYDIRPKVEVLYMGAEIPQTLNSKEKEDFRQKTGLGDEFVVGIVGRIEEAKGQHLVLEAVKRLNEQGIASKALVVGHAMDQKYLETLKEHYTDYAIFTGFTQEAQKYMQLCDALVLATENETFGLVVIEAMMCGVCVVASGSGGPLEIIDEGMNGMLFKTHDVADLTLKLESLCKIENKKETLASKGKVKALEKFESQKQFAKLAELLEGSK